MPGRTGTVGIGDALRLRVTLMSGVVPTAVAQIDPADEGDVPLGPTRVAQHHELLMVRAARPHPHVEQALPSRLLDLLPQVVVLLFAELEPIQVRAPHQPLDDDTAACGVAQHVADSALRTVQQLVRVTPPVREHQYVAGPLRPHGREQLGEVHRPMYQGADVVARGPRRTVGMTAVYPRRGIPPLSGGQQPVGAFHVAVLPAGGPSGISWWIRYPLSA
ncbi:hypothetical protein [Streptomyces mirabilis]|uniref:hypothetical protein n=1 Tax=Streptomyces mirabilis TaxID=68239 RepID=UPI00332AEC56